MAAMDLTTYTGLQAAIASFANRTDLTDAIPGFIALAEADIRLDVRARSVRTTFDITAAAQALPADVQSLQSVRLVTTSPSDDGNLDICTPQALTDHRVMWTTAGRPYFAALVGNELNVVPAPDQPYTAEIVYTPSLTSLSGSNPTNEILAAQPNAYLYGALVAGAAFLEADDPTIAKWQKLYNAAINRINILRDREEFGAAPLAARLPVVF